MIEETTTKLFNPFKGIGVIISVIAQMESVFDASIFTSL